MWLDLVTGMGIVCAILGLSALFNSKRYSKKMSSELINLASIIFIGGVVALGLGLFLLTFNVPVDMKTWIVEVIGWLAILKGLFLLLTPSLSEKFYKILQNRKVLIFVGILVLLIGLILII